MNHLLFWKFKRIKEKVLFIIKKFIYRVSIEKNKAKLSFSVKRSLLKEVIKHLLLCTCMFGITVCIDRFVLLSLNGIIQINDTLLSDILIAMVGVAGVFLGLYCSYISTIFSTKYANCPKVMSNLFENDFITDKSIRSIVNFIIYSIVIILFNLCSFKIGIVTLLVNIISGIYMIVSFIYIGKRILKMTDTYYVSESIYRKIYSYITKVTVPHLFSKDNTFQYNNKKFTQDALVKLEIVNDYNLYNGDNKKISISEFMVNNLNLIQIYLEKKPYIPYNSFWFKSEGYKKWYMASDSEVSIALQTGTNIKNAEIIDSFWFETKVLEINNKCNEKLIENNSIEEITKYIIHFQEVLPIAVRTDNIDFYTNELERLQENAIRILEKDNSEIKKMALVENLIANYISLIIEIRKQFESLNFETIFEDLTPQDYTNSIFNIYCNNAEIEKLFDDIKLEETIEGYRVTPIWYIKLLIAKYINNHIVHCCKAIDLVTNKLLKSLADDMINKKEYGCATLIYSTSLELYHKAQHVLPVLDDCCIKIKEYNTEPQNHIWESYSVSKLKQKTNESFNDIPKKWSECASLFALHNLAEYDNYPDFLGLCYNSVCNYLIQTIADNDYVSFKNAYLHLWSLVSIYQEISRKELIRIKEPYKQDAVISALCNPVLEFGLISGYSILWGEISGDDSWKEIVVSYFDNIVKATGENSHNLCEQIASMLNTPNILRPAIYQKSIIHTGWKQSIERAFEDSGHIKWKQQGFYEIIDSSSELLQKVIGIKSEFELFSIEAYEIFAILVLNNYLEDEKKYKSRSGWENELDNT